MGIKAVGLSVAGLLVTGGVIAGAAGAHADTLTVDPPRVDDVSSQPTPQSVTDAERAQVVAAIQQRDGRVAVHAVRRGADGTFHALGSKSGEPVLAEVSKNRVRVSLHERPVA